MIYGRCGRLSKGVQIRVRFYHLFKKNPGPWRSRWRGLPASRHTDGTDLVPLTAAFCHAPTHSELNGVSQYTYRMLLRFKLWPCWWFMEFNSLKLCLICHREDSSFLSSTCIWSHFLFLRNIGYFVIIYYYYLKKENQLIWACATGEAYNIAASNNVRILVLEVYESSLRWGRVSLHKHEENVYQRLGQKRKEGSYGKPQ